MIRLAAFDIDRTLIPVQTGTVDTQTQEAVRELKRKGIKVAIASGRQWQHLPEILMTMGFDYFVLVNGSVITDARGNVLHQEAIDARTVRGLIRDARARGREIFFRFPEGCCAAEEEVRLQGSTPFGPKVQELPPALQDGFLTDFPFEQGKLPVAGLLSLPEEDARWMEARYPELDFIRVMEGRVCDINIRGVSKATGLERVCARLGIGMADVIAFGDDRNDVEMLREAGIGVAMGGSDDTALAAADYVTGTCMELGVVKALRHFGLVE